MSKYATRRARQESVGRLAGEEPSLSIRALARRLGLSKDTVRRDLAELRRAGRLTGEAAEAQQVAEVARAIASVVSGRPGARVTVTVEHHSLGPAGVQSSDSWTGSPQGLAERILAAVVLTDEQTDKQTERVVAAVRTAMAGGRG